MIYVKVFTGELSTRACRLYVLFIDLQLTNKDIADSIDAEMDGDLQKTFMTIGMQIKYLFIINRTKMFILWIVICFNKCIVPACSIRIAEILVRCLLFACLMLKQRAKSIKSCKNKQS